MHYKTARGILKIANKLRELRKIAEEDRRVSDPHAYINSLVDASGIPYADYRKQPHMTGYIGLPVELENSPENRRQWQAREALRLINKQPYTFADIRQKDFTPEESNAIRDLLVEAGRDSFSRTDPKTLEVKPRPAGWEDTIIRKLPERMQKIINGFPDRLKNQHL